MMFEKKINETFEGVKVVIYPLSPAFITQGGPGCVAVQAIKNGLGNFPKPYFFSFLTLEYHLTKVSHKTHDDDKTNTIRQDHG